MTGTMALTGIFPIGEYLRDYDPKTKKYTRRQLKKYNKIRESIIEKTLQMTEEEILNNKQFADTVATMSEADRIKYLKDNAQAAKNAQINNKKAILLGTLSVGLLAAGIAIPFVGVPAVASQIVSGVTSALSIYTGYRGIKLAIKGSRGLNSDAFLKGEDFKKEFDPYWERYMLVQEEMEKHKDELIEKQKTLSKSDFQEYLDQYTKHIIDIIDEKKKEQEKQDQQSEKVEPKQDTTNTTIDEKTEINPKSEESKINNQNQTEANTQTHQEPAIQE